MIVDSCEPKYLDSLGLGYDDVSQVSPSIIFAAISPFGQDAPYSDFAATDLTALAFGGPVWSSGYDDHSIPPVRGGGNQAYHTVCHFAAIGVLTALVHRQFTGEGQFIDVNMHAAQNVTTEGAVYHWLVAGDTVQRQTGRHSSPTPTANVQIAVRRRALCEHWLSGENGGAVAAPAGVAGRARACGGPVEVHCCHRSRAAIINRDADAIRQMAEVMSAVSELCQANTAYDIFVRAQDLGFPVGHCLFAGGDAGGQALQGAGHAGGCRASGAWRGVRVCGCAIRIQGDAVGYQATAANAWGGQRGGVWGDWDW